MEAALIFSQTVFYLTASVAIIVIVVLSTMIKYHLVHIVRDLEELSSNLNHASSEAGERINDIIDRLSGLPLLSYFIKKHSVIHSRKGRRTSSK